MKIKIALGGGCHWCTEAVFQSLKGVEKVNQGYVASTGENNWFSEAVIVHFEDEVITLKTLIEIHLHTHKSASAHSMRNKYRSAIYTFTEEQFADSSLILNELKIKLDQNIITKIYPFFEFKESRKEIQNYYTKGPEKPFCVRFINPKLELLLTNFSSQIRKDFIKKK